MCCDDTWNSDINKRLSELVNIIYDMVKFKNTD